MAEAIHARPGPRESKRDAPKTFAVEVKTAKKRISEGESAVIARAVEVIGNESEAMRWMGTPVRDLEYATPISLLHTRKGCRAVIAVLERLEYGVL